MQLNFAAREVTIKLVYYGPALSGKTTNLKALHELTSEESHGRLMTLETRDDRTLFFDMLPLVFKSENGDMSLRLKVFTVPGQVL
ncbi:MAG: GTP-binding protein, partial [Polyangiaceae bacterium]